MNGINNIQAEGQLYDILAPEVVNDYVEKLGKPCANPNGYTTGSLILATDGGNVQRLYKVTQAINSSQNIVEDGNVVRKKLGDLFDDLEVALNDEIDDVDTELGNVKQALTNEAKTRAELGAHNLLDIDIKQVKSINNTGSWSGDTYNDTTNGITWTISLTNGRISKITANGTLTGSNSILQFQKADSSHKQDFGNTNLTTQQESWASANGYTLSSSDAYDTKKYMAYNGTNKGLYLIVEESVSNYEFYPMVKRTSDPNNDYQPYAMTNKQLTEAVKCLVLSTGSTTVNALPYTFTNANIENDMVCINSVLSNPSAQTGDWTVTTSSGTAQITGAISGATTITLYLMKSR